jgi:hypothetical protein
MRNFAGKEVDKIKTHVSCSITFSKNRVVYEIMWKNMVEPDKATEDNIIRRMRITCWITTAIDRRPEYLLLIAFPRQQ